MGRQSGLSNGPNGVSYNAVHLGNPGMVSWIRNVVAFENLPLSKKYQWYLQVYNVIPGQRRR